MVVLVITDGNGWISRTERSLYPGMFQYRLGVGGVEEGWLLEFKELLSIMEVKRLK